MTSTVDPWATWVWMNVYIFIYTGVYFNKCSCPILSTVSTLADQLTADQKNHFHIPSYIFPTPDEKYCFWSADGWILSEKSPLWSPVTCGFQQCWAPLCCPRINSTVNSCHICAVWLLKYTVKWWFPEEQDICENGRKSEKIFKGFKFSSQIKQESSTHRRDDNLKWCLPCFSWDLSKGWSVNSANSLPSLALWD